MAIPCLLSICCMLLFSSCASTPSSDKINSAESHMKLGSSYLENEQFNEAFTEFQKAIKLNPRSKETLNYLGYLSTRFKKYDEAILYYKKAISIDPDYADAHYNLAIVLRKLDKPKQAREHYQKAVQLKPDYAEN